MTDFQAHMLTNDEVIGLLVGSGDKDAKIPLIACAKPFAYLADGEDATINVEMNSTSEVEIRQSIATKEASDFCGVTEPLVVVS